MLNIQCVIQIKSLEDMEKSVCYSFWLVTSIIIIFKNTYPALGVI